MNSRLRLFSFFLIFTFDLSYGQQGSYTHIDFALLKSYNDSLYKGSSDEVKEQYNQLFKEAFKNYLAFPGEQKFLFDSLKALTRTQSIDGRLKIYSWMIQTDSFNTYRTFGFIQYQEKKDKPRIITELIETTDTTSRPVNKTYTAANWYSALYYKVVEVKKKKDSYYMLLGWKGNSLKSTKKVIDVLYFLGDKPLFGKKIIQADKSMQSRMIFEFNSQAVMMLRYDEKLKMILFDHLGPADGLLNENYENYGPDFSIDGLKFEDDLWIYVKDVDLRSSEEGTPVPQKRKKEFYKPEE